MAYRVFTTLEQLALSEEKEADLAAALAATAAAEEAAAASQAAQRQQGAQFAAEQVLLITSVCDNPAACQPKLRGEVLTAQRCQIGLMEQRVFLDAPNNK